MAPEEEKAAFVWMRAGALLSTDQGGGGLKGVKLFGAQRCFLSELIFGGQEVGEGDLGEFGLVAHADLCAALGDVLRKEADALFELAGVEGVFRRKAHDRADIGGGYLFEDVPIRRDGELKEARGRAVDAIGRARCAFGFALLEGAFAFGERSL